MLYIISVAVRRKTYSIISVHYRKNWYELEFCLRDNHIEDAYCGCPFPGLCKHLLAVAIMLSVMADRGDLDLSRDFVMIDTNRFYAMIKQNDQTVTV